MAGVLCSMVGASFVTVAAEVIRRKKSVIAFGNAQIDTAQSQFGGASALFDGTGDYLTLGNTGDFDFGTGNFTIEGWIRPSANNSNANRLFSIDDQSYPRILIQTENGVLKAYASNSNSSWSIINGLSFGTLSINTWYHFALTRNGSTFTAWLNGTSINTANSSTAIGNARSVSLLAASEGYQFLWQGHIDEFRISNSARYTSNFTPSTTPFVNDANTLLLLHMDGTDASTFFEDDNGVRISRGISAIGNAQIDTAQSKFGGSSYLGDGTGDYLIVNPYFDLGSSNFTMEAWIRTTVQNERIILAKYASAFPNGFDWTFNLNPSGKLIFQWYDGSFKSVAGATTISTNTWHHVAVVRNGSSLKLYLNGTEDGSGTATDIRAGLSTIWVGAYQDSTPASSWNGHLDEIRVSNTARYTTTFTPSTTPFVNDANTLLLLHMDGTDGSTVFRDDNGVREPKGIYALGNAQIDTAQSKFGGSSALFDGTTDYLAVAPTANLAYGSTDFTIEGWFRFNALPSAGNYTILFDQRPQSTSGAYPTLTLKGSTVVYYANTADRITSSTITTGVWYHIAVSRSGTSTRMFIDGTQAGSTYTDSTTYLTNSNYILVGGDSFSVTSTYNGWIDEFRISNSARYTANFTAPTAPFQNDSNTLLLLHMDGTDGSTVFIDDNGVTPTHQYS